MIRYCAHCSFNELDHDRAMLLSNPIVRHAFVERAEPVDNLNKTAAPTPTIEYLKKNNRDPHIIDADAFEFITPPEGFRFTGLGQIYEGEDIKRGSAIGNLASISFSDDEILKNKKRLRDIGSESTPTTRSEEQDRQYAGRYSEWQKAALQHIVPQGLIKSRRNSSIFEVYKTSAGRMLFIGPAGRDHDFAESGSSASVGQHVHQDHRSDAQSGIVDPLTGRDITIPQGSSVSGPKLPSGRKSDEASTRKAIEDWARQNGTNYEGYMSGLSQQHASLPPHVHPFDLSRGHVYDIITTADDRQVLARVSDITKNDITDVSDSRLGPAPATKFIHSILSQAGAIPDSRREFKEDSDDLFTYRGDSGAARADALMRRRRELDESGESTVPDEDGFERSKRRRDLETIRTTQSPEDLKKIRERMQQEQEEE